LPYKDAKKHRILLFFFLALTIILKFNTESKLN
jgi:hypothetical protein